MNDEQEYNDQVEGRNSVLELLNSDRDVNKLFVVRGEKHGSINKIISIAKQKGVVIVEAERTKLDNMSSTKNHQGVIASIPPFNYSTIEDILEVAKKRNEEPFIVLLDGIEDPHNLGSIIRSAECTGAHGVIIPKRRAVSVNATVSKSSAGAVEHIKIAKVTNLTDTIRDLKEEGLWIVGAEAIGTTKYFEYDFKGAVGVVVGSEGEGISRLVKENCDVLLNIPMRGKINSFNASVSAGIIMEEVCKQRL